jgi:hypothetical protein
MIVIAEKYLTFHSFRITTSYNSELGLTYEAPIRQDRYGDTDTGTRDTAISRNINTAIRRVYI